MPNFHLIDALILLIYLATLSGIGLYFSRRQTNLEEFFLARQSMAWLPVGLSLMAALNSGLDFLMQPSSTITYGLVLLLGTTSWFLLYPWLAFVTLPFYRRLGNFTAYEYLEQRFDARVRTLGAGIFLLWRLGWMGTAIYVPCLALSEATGGMVPLLPAIVVIGVIVTAYTMLGGIQAVIWTDVVQFCVMLGGLLAMVIIVTLNVPGGLGEVFGAATQVGTEGRAAAEASGVAGSLVRFFTQPVTAIGVLISAMVSRMTTYTSDQVMVQRFQTTKSLKDSRQAFVINAAGDAIWMIGLSFVGLALFAYSQHHPLLSSDGGRDKVVPHFIATTFPPGAVGLVIAAVFAASLSSIDSALNSCTSVITVDFYNRLALKRKSGDEEDLTPRERRGQVRVSRIATVACGVIGIILAANVGRIGDLIEISNKVINSFTGPLFGIFLLGMFTHRARGLSVLVGGLVGTAVTVYVAFFTRIGFQWPSTFGLLSTLAVGYLLALVAPASGGAGSALTWRQIMKRAEHGEPSASPARD